MGDCHAQMSNKNVVLDGLLVSYPITIATTYVRY